MANPNPKNNRAFTRQDRHLTHCRRCHIPIEPPQHYCDRCLHHPSPQPSREQRLALIRQVRDKTKEPA